MCFWLAQQLLQHVKVSQTCHKLHGNTMQISIIGGVVSVALPELPKYSVLTNLFPCTLVLCVTYCGILGLNPS